MTTFAIIGRGSIGKRHESILRTMLPKSDKLITIDPAVPADHANFPFGLLQDAIVFICTPTEYHLSTLAIALSEGVRAVFVEKPMLAKGHTPTLNDIPTIPVFAMYQYRYHPVIANLYRLHPLDTVVFQAQDDLAAKYGPTALETMASHSIDAALFINRSAESWITRDDGDRCSIIINHANGCVSQIRCNISDYPRISTVSYRKSGYQNNSVPIAGIDQMYIDQMKAILNYVRTGEVGNLCTYEQAMRVQRIMEGSKE